MIGLIRNSHERERQRERERESEIKKTFYIDNSKKVFKNLRPRT